MRVYIPGVVHIYSTHASRVCSHVTHTGWPRCMGYLILIRHFPQKSRMILGSFAGNDVQLKGILRIPATLYYDLMLIRHFPQQRALYSVFFGGK